jgi:hypothetical protein
MSFERGGIISFSADKIIKEILGDNRTEITRMEIIECNTKCNNS